MLNTFTGKSVPKGVSLPEDLWTYLELVREKVGVPVSTQICRAVVKDIMDRVEARTLVDSREVYDAAKSANANYPYTTTQEVE